MPIHSNYWFDTCHAEYRQSTGLPKKADIVIIGGGIVGLSCLLNVLKVNSGADVVLIEESALATRATGRASGQLMLSASMPFSRLAKKLGSKQAAAYAKFMEANVRKTQKLIRKLDLSCGLVDSGGLKLATTDKEAELLKKEHDFLKRYLEHTTPLYFDADTIAQVVCSQSFRGGLFVPCEATLNPMAYANELTVKLERYGRRILTGCKVDSVTRHKNGLVVEVRNKGTIVAEDVVYCTNAYSSELLPEFESGIVPFRGQMLATNILPESSRSIVSPMSMSINHGQEYMRMYRGRLLAGGMRHSVRDKQENTLFDAEYSPTVYKKLRDFIQSVFPFIDLRVSNIWSGIMCETPDGLPLIGQRPDHPNEWMCLGFNGYGLSHALLSGSMAVDLLFKGQTAQADVAKMFDPRRLLGEK